MFKTIEYKYIVAIIYTGVLFLDRLDLTIVNITLPTLAHYFHVPITQTQWVTNSFLLALVIIIPISGWLGDKFGTKKVFIIATAVFGLASLLCVFSPNLLFMIVMRFLQGLGGGAIIPVGMTMVYRLFAPSEYASITSFTFIPSLIAPAVAPAFGGLITHYFGWQWVFIFAAPICFFIVVVSIFIIQEEKQTSVKSILSIFYDLRFFKNKLFLQANLVQLAFQICHFGSIFLIGMYLQFGIGMSAMTSGFIMGMQAVGAICMSRYSVKLFNRVGPTMPIVVGFIGIAIFTLSILLITDKNMIVFGALMLFLRGIFSGLCGTPIQTASVINIAKQDIGRTNAIFNIGRQLSISIGVALSSLLIGYGFKLNNLHPAQAITMTMVYAVFHYAFFMIPIIALIGIIITLTIDNQKIVTSLRSS